MKNSKIAAFDFYEIVRVLKDSKDPNVILLDGADDPKTLVWIKSTNDYIDLETMEEYND